MRIIIFLFVGYFLCTCSAQYDDSSNYSYPVLFRDHVYHSLSDKGKELFFAVNIHPDCVKKKGACIPRAHCHGREMIYISRLCYKKDLVCCYDKTEMQRNPTVHAKDFTYHPPENTAVSAESLTIPAGPADPTDDAEPQERAQVAESADITDKAEYEEPAERKVPAESAESVESAVSADHVEAALPDES